MSRSIRNNTIVLVTIVIIIAILLIAANTASTTDIVGDVDITGDLNVTGDGMFGGDLNITGDLNVFIDDYGTDYGAVLVMNFEEGTGTIAFDQSPYGNDGILPAKPGTPTWTDGKFGEALSFDGDDYVTVADSTSLDISNNITIEAWAKDQENAADEIIVEKSGAYLLGINDTSTLIGMINTTECTYTITDVTEWHYYTMTYDGANIRLYIDGVLVNTTTCTGTIVVNANDVLIGDRFLGPIDQVRIYTVPKTVGEIRNHYLNSGLTYSGSTIVSDNFRILNSTLNKQLGLDEDGNLVIGGTINGRDINGTYSKTLAMDADKFGRPNVNPPALVDQDNVQLWAFTLDTDKVYFKFPVPYDYASGLMYFNITWTNDGGIDDDGLAVKWQFDYQIASSGEVISGSHANSPKAVEDTYSGATGWIETHTNTLTIASADFSGADCFFIKLSAITPVGAPLSCEPHLVGVCYTYTAYSVMSD